MSLSQKVDRLQRNEERFRLAAPQFASDSFQKRRRLNSREQQFYDYLFEAYAGDSAGLKAEAQIAGVDAIHRMSFRMMRRATAMAYAKW